MNYYYNSRPDESGWLNVNNEQKDRVYTARPTTKVVFILMGKHGIRWMIGSNLFSLLGILSVGYPKSRLIEPPLKHPVERSKTICIIKIEIVLFHIVNRTCQVKVEYIKVFSSANEFCFLGQANCKEKSNFRAVCRRKVNINPGTRCISNRYLLNYF